MTPSKTDNLNTIMPKQPRITLATSLTISRFFLVPVFISFFLAENFKFAVGTLILASFTDMLDGFLARNFDMRSRLGSMLDPLADKFMMTVSFITLSIKGVIPWWVTAIIIGRDFYIIVGVFFLNNIKRIQLIFKPTKLSKLTTFSHFMLLTLSFIEFFIIRRSLGLQTTMATYLFNSQQFFVCAASILTIVTFFQYTYIGVQFLKHGERKPAKILH